MITNILLVNLTLFTSLPSVLTANVFPLSMSCLLAYYYFIQFYLLQVIYTRMIDR